MDQSLVFRNAGEAIVWGDNAECVDAVIVPVEAESLSAKESEQSMIEWVFASREQVQKLIAVADFELRSFGASYD